MENYENAQVTNDEKPRFKGYTINELKYQRALSTLHREYAKDKIIRSANNLRNRSIFGKSGKSSGIKGVSLVGKLAKGMSYADYAMIGFSIFGTVRKVWKLFRHK